MKKPSSQNLETISKEILNQQPYLGPEEAFVLVPKDTQSSPISEGSGIVATTLEPEGEDNKETFIVDFEGNLYGASNLNTIEEKIFHALDRQLTRYPTIARLFLKKEDLLKNYNIVGIANREKISIYLKNNYANLKEQSPPNPQNGIEIFSEDICRKTFLNWSGKISERENSKESQKLKNKPQIIEPNNPKL